MNSKLKKNFAKIMTLALVTSITVGSIPNMVKAEEVGKLLNMPLTVESKEQILEEFKNNIPKNETLINNENQEEMVRLIVEVDGKSAQDMVPKGTRASEKENAIVEVNQEPIRQAVESMESVDIRHSYTNVFNGFSVDAQRKDIENIKAINGVKSVKEATKYVENMSNATKLTQVEDVWKKYSLKGEGMVVAILDTGIDYKHKDFKNPKDTSKLKLNRDAINKIKESGVLKADPNADTYFTEKIPFGYNYSDKNTQIVDLRDSKSPHGAHVAGIVGADGDENLIESNGAVRGVAPETQLLAMKVFSNGPLGKYTYSDDQLAAIDDAVALGADVINMSLGGPAGFRNDAEPVQDAITRATDAGVMVVVSAGNSSTATNPYGIGVLNDQITVGDPALAKDALMVSSYENTHVANKIIEFKDEKNKKIASGIFAEHQVDFRSIYNKNNEIINCGLGKNEELGKVKGKVALVKRGDISFIDKIVNAQNNGATGVIIYNSDKDETIINMVTDPSIKIPAIFVPNSVGEAIKKSKNKVLFNGDLGNEVGKNQNSGDYSDFTSWGPSPSLEFKPQIAAPGGQIYSTLNEGEHGVMSGTSMSAPHTSGVMTLLLESMKNSMNELSGREKMDYAKNNIMNTAQVELDKKHGNTPFSPRRQGAGLTQVEDAIRNRVTITNNGKASVELKEIKENKVTFTLDLKNYGDKQAEYKIESLGNVLTQDETIGEMVHDRELGKSEANLEFSAKNIIVPAKGNASVNVTLNIGSSFASEQYLEGYIKFESKDKNIPSLSIPYMGFYGEWDKEKITTNNAWDKEKHILVDTVNKNGGRDIIENLALSSFEGIPVMLGLENTNEIGKNIYNKDKIAISPNEDKLNDVIYPGLYLMRNAKQISAQVLDSEGKVIRNVGTITQRRKQLINSEVGKLPQFMAELSWDGRLFDKSKGNFVNAKDGNYTYRIKMKVDYNGAKEQIVDMPVKIDTNGPDVQIVKCENAGVGAAKIYFTATDDASGVDMKPGVCIIKNGVMEPFSQDVEYDEKTGLYCKLVTGLKDNALNQIRIGILDYARNLNGSETVIPVGNINPVVMKLDDENLENGQTNVKENKYIISGTINRAIKDLFIGGEKIDVNIKEDGTATFEKQLELKEGLTVVNIKAVDYDGKILRDYGYKIYCDTVKPTINITEPEVTDGKVKLSGNKVVLKGNVSDNLGSYNFYVNGELNYKSEFDGIVSEEKGRHNFEIEVNELKDGDFILLKVVDNNENATEIKLQVVK
ncbi:S8 family serine peptidase [Clostridium ihumii]|uniref:S8 family serine peptidase n=1 Tax=Clostridium ihumii TaxID=1470356 RepID=UPI003D33260E